MFERSSSFAKLAIAVALLVPLGAQADIFVGPYTPSTAHPFVVPLEIRDAAQVTSFQFDLLYDASDVEINTSCDPSADAFCDAVTGPVTQGPFFGSLSPFNVFDPGFILEDALDAQIGTLLAVNGIYGGPPPGPSGSGTVAYVEFVTTSSGTGTSPITVANATIVSAAVPEPASGWLVSCASLCLAAWRRAIRRRAVHARKQS